MIVHRPELQAYECDGCGRMYEIRRAAGSEDEMNKALDFKKRIELRHEDCKPKGEMDAAMVVIQQGASATVA